MKDKDYDADFPAGVTLRDWVFGLPFLLLGKTVEVGISLMCKLRGHRIVVDDYCLRCHSHIDS